MFLPTAVICTIIGFAMLLSVEIAIAKAFGFL
jgi:predicted RND superfamily exporter protein